MATVIAGDIGGTKTILRLVQYDSGTNLSASTLLYEHTYPSQDFPDLVPIVNTFLTAATEKIGAVPAIARACFGIAGPVVNNTCQLTNLSWFLEADRLAHDLTIPRVDLINDFAAVGYGVLGLADQDLHILQVGEPNPDAPIAVLGAGTGLGQAFLIPQAGSYRVFPTEGGHADFPPRSELEFQLLNYLLERHNVSRVSVERVVSGLGIISIYEFLRDRQVAQESPHMAEIFKTWQQQIGQDDKTVDPAAEISKAAMAKTDYLCQKTMALFLEAYGAEAGNIALKFLPYGGLYVAGGIAAKILPLMESGGFMRAFSQKGRMSSMLEKVPVRVVLNPQVGLIGAALYAADDR